MESVRQQQMARSLSRAVSVCCLGRRGRLCGNRAVVVLGLRSYSPQGNIRMALHRRRKAPPPFSPQTKETIVGQNEIYRRENVVGLLLVRKLLGPRPPPPF